MDEEPPTSNSTPVPTSVVESSSTSSNRRTLRDLLLRRFRNPLVEEKERVFKGEEWLIAVKLEMMDYELKKNRHGEPVNSKKYLKEIGIRHIRRHDKLFYEVDPLPGWTKDYMPGRYYMYFKDAAGRAWINQHYDPDIQNPRAHITIVTRESRSYW